MATSSSNSNRTHITVLIEQKDFTPFAAFRRASLTPSLATTSSNGTVTAGAGGGGEWKRGQRSSTTLHASIDCPDSLLASLSSITIVCIQPNLLPLPSARPLVLLVQLSDYIPPELSTTPSSICFPPMATPTPKSIQRALVPLKLAVSSLDGVNQRNDVAILAYSDNVHLPVEITNAAYNNGAHGLMTPPFTPDSVEAAIHSALERHARQPPIPYITHTPRAPIYPPTPESTTSPLPISYDSIDPLDTSHYNNNNYDMHDAHDTHESNEINVTVSDNDQPKGIQCPKADIPLTRRTSIDLGGLHLAVDSGNGSKLNANGSGWAGWDASLPGNEFDEGRNELDIAQLLLSMHIQATAALANASSSSTQANGTPVGYHSHQHSHPLQPSSPYSQPSLHRSPSANALNSMGSTAIVNVATTNPRTIYRLIAAMGSWHFEPYLLSPPETLLCVQLLFTSLLTSLSTIPNIFPPQSTARSSNAEERLQEFIHTSMVPFISDLSKLYRRENRYHSFVHALDVLQAVYTFLEREGRVAPIREMGMVDAEKDLNTGGRWTNKRVPMKKRKPRANEEDGEQEWSGLDLLEDRDLFLLALAAIGHDVGHPGNSNAFLKNAQAPLSKIYDDRSALERMHCALLLRLLKAHGMGHLVSHESQEGKEGRWLISGTVLATDMSWHFEWVENFDRSMKARRIVQQLRRPSASAPKHQQQASISLEERRGSAIRISERDSRRGSATELIVKGKEKGSWVVEQTDLEVALAEGQLTLDDVSKEETERQDRLLVCQALMKCADISNPCRPHSISRHWSTVLLEEWAAQALLERHLGLPVSVVAEANEKVQCVGQVSFIKLFTQPLFDMVAEAVPGLSFVAQQCTENRVLWEQRLATFEASTAPSSPQPQMVRPIPLALPILASMSRYAKTVIPLSLPNLADRKKQSRAVRELAAMSPWYGMKSSGNSGTSAAGTSVSGGGNGTSSRVWTRSRPESVSSTSTLSSLPSTGAAAISPSTPTSTGFASSVVGGRSPASPTVSMAPFGLPLITSSVANLNATPGSSGYNPYSGSGAPLNSVWDVDPEIADKAVRELRHGWAVRDGRKERRAGENEMVMAWAMGKRASGNLDVVQAD